MSETIRHLLAALLPGGAGFPPALETGCAALLAARLDPALAVRLTDDIARLEALEPALFEAFRKQAYLAYYEQPEVIAAIRALGHPYNDTPLPDGYPDEPFDPARDAPTHRRGRWISTDEVRPLDLATLDLPS